MTGQIQQPEATGPEAVGEIAGSDVFDCLRTGDVEDHNEPELEGGTRGKRYLVVGGIKALAKPEDGVDGNAEMIQRETAASVVAEALGWSALIAPTVLRRLNLDAGEKWYSLQQVWEREPNPSSLSEYPMEDLERAAILDFLLVNLDRYVNHNYVTTREGPTPRLHLVDHGHSWGYQGEGCSGIMTEMAGRDISSSSREALTAMLGDGAAIEAVRDLLGDAQAERLRLQAQTLLVSARLPVRTDDQGPKSEPGVQPP